MEKLSVRDLGVKGRRVLVRVDFNVPIEEIDGKIRITDDTRVRESLPTIELLRAKGAKVVCLLISVVRRANPIEIFAEAGCRSLGPNDSAASKFFSARGDRPERRSPFQSLARQWCLLVENVAGFFPRKKPTPTASLKPLQNWVTYTSTTLSVRLTVRMPVRLE